MFLAEVESAVLNMVRERIRSGETTERALARSAGISQPHIHNVLKGTRRLSPQLMDQILRQLHLSVLDALDHDVLRRFVSSRPATGGVYLPVLDGAVGPGNPWPTGIREYACFPVPPALLKEMWQPVVVRAAEDARMAGIFNAGDMVVLDQSLHCRTYPQAGRYYIVKCGNYGMIRQIRTSENRYFIVAEDSIHNPEGWEELRSSRQNLARFVRARAEFPGGWWGDSQDFCAASR